MHNKGGSLTTHLVSEHAVVTFGPEVVHPIQASQLEVLQLVASSGNVRRVLLDALKLGAIVEAVLHRAVREHLVLLTLPEVFNFFAGEELDLVVF